MFKTDDYTRLISSLKGKIFYLYDYRGNAGDTLIRLGTLQLYKELGIAVEENPEKADIIVCPGGNFSMWRINAKGFNRLIETYPEKSFILGPAGLLLSLFDAHIRAQKTYRKVIGIFARDPESFSYLKKIRLSRQVKTGLANDPTLHLIDSPFMAEQKRISCEKYILASFRDDLEAEAFKNTFLRYFCQLPPYGIMRSVIHRLNAPYKKRKIEAARAQSDQNYPLKVCDASLLKLEDFLETIRNAKEVHTDRMHVFLLAFMLGKPVFIYPTGYAKLESIYQYSIKDLPGAQAVKIINRYA